MTDTPMQFPNRPVSGPSLTTTKGLTMCTDNFPCHEDDDITADWVTVVRWNDLEKLKFRARQLVATQDADEAREVAFNLLEEATRLAHLPPADLEQLRELADKAEAQDAAERASWQAPEVVAARASWMTPKMIADLHARRAA